jgi:threonyl-tRNA synthetase
MQSLAINNQFGFFVPSKRNSNQSRKKNSVESVIPSQPKVQEYKDSGYYLDSLSELTRNQSLTPEQIAKSQTKVIDGEVNSLSRKYEISNFEEVKNFISKNRFLIPLLEEIPNKIFQYYGSQQKIALELFYEPDFPQSSKLWVSVLTELSAEEARSIMDKIDGEWWLENIDRAKCKLNIGIDYV